MLISDWSSDVCSSDLHLAPAVGVDLGQLADRLDDAGIIDEHIDARGQFTASPGRRGHAVGASDVDRHAGKPACQAGVDGVQRSEERRVGEECVGTFRSREWTYPSKKNKKQNNN